MKIRFLLPLIRPRLAMVFQEAFIGLAFLVLLPSCVSIDETEPYRSPPYHALTTTTPPKGVERIDAHQLELLMHRGNFVLIDVFGALFREESLFFEGDWLISEPRKNIPGSEWLPNVGKESLDALFKQYFEIELQRLTENDKNKEIVFYCIEDCWMSWNASKRANAWGYSRVMWFREGVDGWLDRGGRLESSQPVRIPVND